MARTKGMLNLSGNLEVNAGAPLDARSVVPTLADLTVAANFQYKYIGMTVTVQATGDMYVLTANDVTVAANWKQIGSGGGGTSYTAGDGIVIDNDEISTDNMPAADMAEIVTPLPSVMSRLPRYSTEEQIVGYWTNGKPIYQKVVSFPSVTGWNVAYTEPNAEIICIPWAKYHLDVSPIEWLILNYYGGANSGCLLAIGDANNTLIMNNNFATGSNHEVVAIIQYTKTTD